MRSSDNGGGTDTAVSQRLLCTRLDDVTQEDFDVFDLILTEHVKPEDVVEGLRDFFFVQSDLSFLGPWGIEIRDFLVWDEHREHVAAEFLARGLDFPDCVTFYPVLPGLAPHGD